MRDFIYESLFTNCKICQIVSPNGCFLALLFLPYWRCSQILLIFSIYQNSDFENIFLSKPLNSAFLPLGYE